MNQRRAVLRQWFPPFGRAREPQDCDWDAYFRAFKYCHIQQLSSELYCTLADDLTAYSGKK
jgi:hypothetical protein